MKREKRGDATMSRVTKVGREHVMMTRSPRTNNGRGRRPLAAGRRPVPTPQQQLQMDQLDGGTIIVAFGPAQN